jgi:Zn-dependent protease with chaperone function
MPEAVLLHSQPTFFVGESGIRTFNGEVKGRVLALGLPALGGLTVNELRAVLAHEFAHFSGGDLAYSSRVVPVYEGAKAAWIHMTWRSEGYLEDSFIRRTAFKLPMFIPRFLLLAYVRLFHTINMSISRTREARADALSVNVCGSHSFIKGLSKTAGISRLFRDEASLAFARKARESQEITNHFHAFRVTLPQMTDLAKLHATNAYNAPQGKDDAHPCLKSRISAAGNVPEQFDDNRPATVLIANLESYEQQMAENMNQLMQMMNARR